MHVRVLQCVCSPSQASARIRLVLGVMAGTGDSGDIKFTKPLCFKTTESRLDYRNLATWETDGMFNPMSAILDFRYA